VKNLKAIIKFIVPIFYLTAFCVCLFLGIDFEGRINGSAFIAFILALPWGLLMIPFFWAFIHGAMLEFFFVILLASAILNSFLIYRIGAWLTKGKED